jgi:hypothetical protein
MPPNFDVKAIFVTEIQWLNRMPDWRLGLVIRLGIADVFWRSSLRLAWHQHNHPIVSR